MNDKAKWTDVFKWAEDVTWNGPNFEVVHLLKGDDHTSFTQGGHMSMGHVGTATHSADGTKL